MDEGEGFVDSETSMGDIANSLQNVENAIGGVEQAVGRVEEAIRNKWSTAQWIGVALIGTLLLPLPGRIWHSKWRYAFAYGVSSDKVLIDNAPHDCAFLAAPLGAKYCHYEGV